MVGPATAKQSRRDRPRWSGSMYVQMDRPWPRGSRFGACARFYGRAATLPNRFARPPQRREAHEREISRPPTGGLLKSSGTLAVLVPCRFCWRWQHLKRAMARRARAAPSLIMATAAADPA